MCVIYQSNVMGADQNKPNIIIQIWPDDDCTLKYVLSQK